MTHNVKESRIKNLLKRSKGKNSEVLFHHRFSTSTADVPNACHPFSTKNFFESNYVGVHNGVIWNDDELEKQHLELGINYVSKQPNGQFNDSEALIYDIARYLEGDVTELTAEGTIAFIVIKRDKDGKATTMFFGRNNGNPLKMKKTKHSLTLSSEGEGESIKANTLYSYDYETGVITERYMYIPSYTSSKSNYGFSSQRSTSYDYQGYENGYVANSNDTYDDEYYDRKYGITGGSEAYNIINAGGFVGRSGTNTQVKEQFLQENAGDYERAAIAALVELEEVQKEINRVDDAVYSVLSDYTYEQLSDYWYFLQTYYGNLGIIAKELEESSVVTTIIQKNSKIVTTSDGEVQSDGSIVFPSGITVTKEEQSLLALPGLS